MVSLVSAPSFKMQNLSSTLVLKTLSENAEVEGRLDDKVLCYIKMPSNHRHIIQICTKCLTVLHYHH